VGGDLSQGYGRMVHKNERTFVPRDLLVPKVFAICSENLFRN